MVQFLHAGKDCWYNFHWPQTELSLSKVIKLFLKKRALNRMFFLLKLVSRVLGCKTNLFLISGKIKF